MDSIDIGTRFHEDTTKFQEALIFTEQQTDFQGQTY